MEQLVQVEKNWKAIKRSSWSKLRSWNGTTENERTLQEETKGETQVRGDPEKVGVIENKGESPKRMEAGFLWAKRVCMMNRST
jgi:hypothetical protein